MTFLRAVIIGFIVLESTNVFALYFFPDTWYANSVGVFKAWHSSKDDPQVHDLVRYLVNWVAGTKLIFIALLIAILASAEDRVVWYAAAAAAIAISSFFWRLFPLARKMDREGQMTPDGYSKALGGMIAGLIIIIVAALVITAAV